MSCFTCMDRKQCLGKLLILGVLGGVVTGLYYLFCHFIPFLFWVNDEWKVVGHVNQIEHRIDYDEDGEPTQFEVVTIHTEDGDRIETIPSNRHRGDTMKRNQWYVFTLKNVWGKDFKSVRRSDEIEDPRYHNDRPPIMNDDVEIMIEE